MNNVCLIGRMVKTPELKEYGKGKNAGVVTRFTLAVQRDADTADFISCVAFGKTAEMIDTYMKKGSKLGVTGSIQTGSYEDKDGNKRYTTDVIVRMVDFCDSKKEKEEDEEDEKPRKRSTKKSRRREEGDEDEDEDEYAEYLYAPDYLDNELPFA